MMSRWIYTLLLAAICWAGCTRTYTYTYSEIVRKPERLRTGDRLQILMVDGDLVKGTLVETDDGTVVITVSTGEEARITWMDIKLLERFENARVQID